MNKTPLAEHIRIVLYGLRNAGKSSLMNNLFEKEISIVSDTPGTTTDPVTRTFELGKLGPVALCDTAGIDDIGDLGKKRAEKTIQQVKNSDIVIFVTPADRPLLEEEKIFLQQIKEYNKHILIALTFGDKEVSKDKHDFASSYPFVIVDNIAKKGFNDLRKNLITFADKLEYEITPMEGLVTENDFVILVTPIDLAAPKGRLILPQVETIRDLLDKDCGVLVVKERELGFFYNNLQIKPKLVVTDSQAFSKVAADLPQDQLLTSFSILFARKKGDLSFFTEGAKRLSHVPAGAKILVLESCSHHRQADDIGTVKIPRLFRQLVQPKAEFTFARQIPAPDELKEYHMVINCGGCMVNRNAMMRRVEILKESGVYGLNYGLFLAWVNGLLPRALEVFPYEYDLFKAALNN